MKELQHLIYAGESETLDFKKRITQPDRIARTIASFANTRGGLILVGVMDNGQITGIDPEEEKHILTIAAEQFCDPPVKLFFKEIEEDNKTVLKVIIPESADKPHLIKIKENEWRGYIRINDETVQTDKIPAPIPAPETTQTLLQTLELNEIILIEFLKKHRRITLKQFMQLVNISRQNAGRILVKLVLQEKIQHHEKENFYTL